MLTPFGKACRKLRIDRGELLKDMADKLEVTSSYLSAVEIGKRNIPKEWPEMIAKLYGLKEADQHKLLRAARLSQKTVSLQLDNLSGDDRELAFAFARDFGELDEVDKDKIKKILNKRRRQNE